MTQNQLDRLVADATGEDLREIQRLGFSLADPIDVEFDPEPDELSPQMIDWDEVDLRRNVAVVEQPPIRRFAA
jgi:hypothetical protein